MSEDHEKPTRDGAARYAAWVRALIERQFAIRQGELWIEACSVTELAERFGTPFFVYSEQGLAATWDQLRQTFPPRCQILYSMKANPQPAIVRYFLACGSGIEIASGGELRAALAAGCSARQIVFAGPGKTDAELSLAIESDLGEIHAESVGELRRIDRLASAMGGRARVGLRVNPALASAVGSLQMGGRATPFGIDEERLEPVLNALAGWPALEFVGLHLNTGTQLLEAPTILTYYRHAVALAGRVAEQVGRPLQSLDLGGGLGIPYFVGQSDLDLSTLQRGLADLSASCAADPWLQPLTWLIEPGRYLVGPAGVYVARVVDTKESRGQRFAVLDGGMHHHLAASGNFGQVIRRAFPLAVLNRLDAVSDQAITVVGPLCTPLDTLGKQVPLPDLRVGDLIGIFQAGAYARTSSPLHFLGHPTPPEVWIHGAHSRLIRRRGRWDDAYRDVVE